jgi:alkylation response protein AidB-like acyl-CoA dehydrogenase
VRFDFTAEQLAFRDVVRELLARECPPARVRAAWDGAAPMAAWPQLAGLGVVGMTAPERWMGLGLGELDLVLILEEAGRAALPDPLLEHTAVAIPLLTDAGDDAVRDRWLAEAASGRAVVTVGLAGAPFVVDAARAQLLVLERGDELHAVPRDDVAVIAEPSVDGARRLFRVDWRPAPATLFAACPAARAAFDRAFDRGAVAAAAQLCGLAGHLLDVTVEYAQVRRQFGRPIGSFQAVKHRLADALVALELARPCVYRAAHAIERGEPERSVHASLAKALASDAARKVAAAALQCHGAIGYSFEHDLHLWMKRIWALAAAWGDAAWHRGRIARAILDRHGGADA